MRSRPMRCETATSPRSSRRSSIIGTFLTLFQPEERQSRRNGTSISLAASGPSERSACRTSSRAWSLSATHWAGWGCQPGGRTVS